MRNAPVRLFSPACRAALAAGVIASLSIGSALAQEAANAEAASTPEAAKPDRNAKVCEYELVTGSRMRKKICMTQERRDARADAGRELTRELERKELAVDGGP